MKFLKSDGTGTAAILLLPAAGALGVLLATGLLAIDPGSL